MICQILPRPFFSPFWPGLRVASLYVSAGACGGASIGWTAACSSGWTNGCGGGSGLASGRSSIGWIMVLEIAGVGSSADSRTTEAVADLAATLLAAAILAGVRWGELL